MTFQIIIKGKNAHQKLGKTRSEQEKNLRKEWGQTMSNEQLDKLKFAEEKMRKASGQTKYFIPGHVIDRVK